MLNPTLVSHVENKITFPILFEKYFQINLQNWTMHINYHGKSHVTHIYDSFSIKYYLNKDLHAFKFTDSSIY